MRLLALIVLFVCAGLDLHAAGALGKPRYNNDVAFNEIVRLEFSTMLPDLQQVNIPMTIINAMDMPNNRPNWFLAGDPIVTINEKTRFVKIQLSLLPRQTGVLSLPEIPMSWLSDDSIPNLGQVNVRQEITMGKNAQPLPAELESVGGFSWKIDMNELNKKLGDAAMRQEGDDTIYTTKDGLELIIRKQRLAGARLHSAGWHLRQARFNFIDRWGDPRVNGINSETPHMTWLIGWLRIHASEVIIDGKPQIDIYITREDVENKLIEATLTKDVFKLLETDQTNDELWKKSVKDKPKAPEATGETPAKIDSENSDTKLEVEQPAVGKPSRSLTTDMPVNKSDKPISNTIDPQLLEDLFKDAQKNTTAE